MYVKLSKVYDKIKKVVISVEENAKLDENGLKIERR